MLVRVSRAVRRHHDHVNSYKGKHLIGVAYIFRAWSIIIKGRHGGQQVDIVLEKDLRVLHLDLQATGDTVS